MLEVRLSAFCTKITPCLELPWGLEHTWAPVSYSHKAPGKFCPVQHLKLHRDCPGSHHTRMDNPIQGWVSQAFSHVPLVLGQGSVSHLGPPVQGRWRGWKTPPAAWEAPVEGRAWAGQLSKETPKRHQILLLC